jgi:amino acid permease
MEVSVEAGNAGAAEWLDDDGRPRRKGTFWTASAHIITAVIGSGVLSLAWAIAQLGWVAGPAAMLLFAFVTYYTATLLAECYRTGDPDTGKRNYTYMDAVRSNLGGKKVVFCGVIQYANLVGVAIGYTIASSISMKAIRIQESWLLPHPRSWRSLQGLQHPVHDPLRRRADSLLPDTGLR